jgi:glutamate--cysteine ligase
VKSADDILKMSSKEKKKISYAKGGGELREVIIQEGVPTQVTAADDGSVSEPVIYLIGNELAGGFLRAHKEKGRNDNLNSPGSVFKKLCMSDLIVNVEGSPLENVYGTIARVNNLAIGMESRDVGAVYGFLQSIT